MIFTLEKLLFQLVYRKHDYDRKLT